VNGGFHGSRTSVPSANSAATVTSGSSAIPRPAAAARLVASIVPNSVKDTRERELSSRSNKSR
jgi:hypothetical protein